MIRWARSLDRARVCLDIGERDELPVVPGLFHHPDRPHGADIVLHPRAAPCHRDAQRRELRRTISGPHPNDEPTSGDDIEARELLGEHKRISLGQDDDATRHPDGPGVGGDQCQGNRRVEHGGLGGKWGIRGFRVGKHDVLPGPDRFEPCHLGRLRDPNRSFRVATGRVVDGKQPDLHGWHGEDIVASLRIECPLSLGARPTFVSAGTLEHSSRGTRSRCFDDRSSDCPVRVVCSRE